MRTRLSGVGILMVMGGAALGLGGCAGRGVTMNVPIQGPALPADYPTTVDVTNWNGSVYVVADPGAKAPEVAAKVRRTSGGMKPKELPGTVTVTAQSSISATERLLKVNSAPAGGSAAPVAVDLYVRVPKSDGVQVRNSGGPVELVRVGGAVQVENGAGGRPGGDVQIRTGDAMTKPASLMTSQGKVLYQVGPGSSGNFTLMTDKGDVQFASHLGDVKEVVPEPTRWRGILNNGSNPVVLHSGEGQVRVLVIENAATYGPELWDGWPTWPKEPKWLGYLGGYYNDEPVFGKGKQGTTPGQ